MDYGALLETAYVACEPSPALMLRLAAVLLLLSGCASAAQLDAGPLTESRLEAINDAVAGQTATVEMIERGGFATDSLVIGADSTVWMDIDGAFYTIATRDIHLVRVPLASGMSAGDGVILGVIGGAVVAYALAGTGESWNPSGFGGDGGIILSIPGALLGALVGVAAGAAEPTEQTFILHPRPPAR